MILSKIMDVLVRSFEDYMLLDLTEETTFSLLHDLLPNISLILVPIMLIAMVGGVIANYMQVGFLFSTESIQFKLEKIDPIKGAKRIFSIRALVELLKSSLKISFVGIVTFVVLWGEWDGIMRLSQVSLDSALAFLATLVLKMGLAATVMLLLLAVFDYAYQKYDFEKNIRMSKQDIKDEYKNIEGDPHIKSKIKQKQREMAMSRMMQEIPKADVIITNPTHYAVALKYDESKMDAPYVIGSGVDYIALKIRSIANNHDIPTIENRPLARALYEQTEIGDAVPEEFFKAVAEILAYIYRLKHRI
jgi:flagellar biosynthetic protein FlhB